MKFAATILLLISLAHAVTNDEGKALKAAIQDLFKAKPNMISKAVRLTYHDLLYHSTPVGAGCIEKRSFQNMNGNLGFVEIIADLKKIIQRKELEKASITLGDAIAFAGKIAVETAYPCVRIAFKFGRPSCGNRNPTTRSSIRGANPSAPDPTLASLSDISPFTLYLGMNQGDYAVLTIGAHAVMGARAHRGTSGVDGNLSRGDKHTLKTYVDDTLKNVWQIVNSRGFGIRFVSNQVMRFVSDMVYFPDVRLSTGGLTKRKSKDKDKKKDKKDKGRKTVFSIQEQFQRRAILTKLKGTNGGEFAKVFERMLTLSQGGANQIFNDVDPLPAECGARQRSTTDTGTTDTGTNKIATLVNQAFTG
jgi:hypothetical protein